MMIDKHQGTVESLAQFRRSMANRSPVSQQQQQQQPPPNRRRRNSLVDGDDEGDSKRLLVVDFSGMCLDFLPSPSVNLAAIYKLDLSNNNLENIPESLVARLLNVVVLDVHSNQLTCLPNSIGCLSKLKILNVSANLLSSIPRTIENCRSLEELTANFNKLIALPETIGFELVNLKKLSVNSNKITLLPYSTSHLTELRILDVRLNSLHALPDDLENLINLQVLNVSQNFHHLSALPYSVGLLLSLSELDISYNRIAALPPSLGCLPELRRLCVEGNPLVSPPIDVVEFGLHAVKMYLTEKMNAGEPNGRQRRTWFGRLKKHPTMNSRVAVEGRRSNPIEAIASPRHILRMLSPRRLFSSPQHSFSRLTSSELLK